MGASLLLFTPTISQKGIELIIGDVTKAAKPASELSAVLWRRSGKRKEDLQIRL